MGANTEASDRPARKLPADDLRPGPEGWEVYVTRAFLSRLETAVEGGDDPDHGLPPPSDLETLVSDVLTALYGPRLSGAVPERLQGTPEVVEALQRIRQRRADVERGRAIRRLAGRFGYPVHRARWTTLRADAVREIDRRQEEEDGRTPWYVRPDALAEALRSNVVVALADPRVQGATVEELEGRLRSALEDAFVSDVAPERPNRERLTDPAKIPERPAAVFDRDPRRVARFLADAEEARLRDLAHLTPSEERVWLLHYHRDLTPSEIAGEVGSTPGSARVLLHRARRKMQAAVSA